MASHMDRFDEMRIFTRIVERRSFTVAAEELSLPRASVTNAIKRLETRVGTRLLERTTRVVSATLDGQAYYTNCVRLLADLSEMENVFRRDDPAGLLRVSLHPSLARQFIAPALPAFLERYPGIELHIVESDCLIEVVRENIDCVLGVGHPGDTTMVLQEVGQLERATCASPTYLNRHGRPRSLDELAHHRAVNIISPLTTRPTPFEYLVDGAVRKMTLSSTVAVTGAEMHLANAIAGLGIIQIPRYRVEQAGADTLEIILPQLAQPTLTLYAIYPRSRQLSPRVRVFVDFLKDTLKDLR